MTVKERYLNDATFHMVVDHLRLLIADARLAPSEVREAAMLACILEEERRLFTTEAVCSCLSIGRDPLCWFHGDRDKMWWAK